MKKPKQSNKEANRTRTYSFRYDDLSEPQNGSLQLLSATVHADIWKLLTDVIVKLCAYEYVEHDKEYQERFNRVVGERVTRQKVQRWLLGTLIYKLQRCLTITLGSHLEADVTTGDFASELTWAVRPEEAGQIYKEPIEKLSRELVSIANQNRPAILDEVYRRQQIAHDALAIIIPFRLSAMLIGLLANGFIAAVSRPAIPELVEMVERGFLPSLKHALLPTRPPGDTRSSNPWEGRLADFKRTVDDWFPLINYIREYSKEYRRKPWAKWIEDETEYKRLSEGRDKVWISKVITLISERMAELSEAKKSNNTAKKRECSLALGALGLTCDLATQMLNPPILKTNGKPYPTERNILYYRKAGGNLGSRRTTRRHPTS